MRMRIKKLLPFFIAAAICQCSCGHPKRNDCVEHIRTLIVRGSTAQFAESELKKCGFRTAIELDKKSLYADKSVVIEGTMVSERTQVSVSLDADNRVSRVVITTSLTGP